MDNKIIFKNKSLPDILSDIYDNSINTNKEIKELIDSLTPLITSPSEAIMLVPLISNYMNTKVKNDENLIKMANIIQRSVDSNKVSEGSMMLPDSEMEAIYVIAQEMEKNKKELLLENDTQR